MRNVRFEIKGELMCGINAYIQFESRLGRDDMCRLVHGMNECIVHRGPDSEGLYADDRCALGMRRLSIIDLEGGNQPIWNHDHTLAIVFNGEVYNYRELRKSLITQGFMFKTNSDTEVVLLGYERYGLDVLPMLEGMFAFVIYDVTHHKWIAARDRIGEKPLYYYHDEGKLLIASELKSITGTGLVRKEIDPTAFSQYFQLTYIPAPRTIYKSVYKLPAASYMEIDSKGNIAIHRYWSLDQDIKNKPILTYKEYKHQLRDALFSSVEQRMISDVPIGAFLSGGFDSSIVVGIMSQLSPGKVNTFNVAFDNKLYDESELAALVARRNATNHVVLELNEDEVLADLPTVLGNMGEPFADSSLIAVHAISKQARKYVKVVLTGDGGDELFAGYNKYLMPYYGNLYRRVPRALRTGLFENALNLLPSKSYRTQGIRKVMNAFDLSEVEQARYMMSLGYKPQELRMLVPGIEPESLGFIYEQYDYFRDSDAQTRTQYVDICTVLEGDMLPKVDRGSMLVSLETRVPMLDTGAVELAFSIPTEYKIKGRDRKIILKDAFVDLLPRELFSAPKHGFGVPVSDWLETQLKEQLLRYADKDFLQEQGIFDHAYITKVIEEHMTHKIDRFSMLWTFFVFQNWYEREMV